MQYMARRVCFATGPLCTNLQSNQTVRTTLSWGGAKSCGLSALLQRAGENVGCNSAGCKPWNYLVSLQPAADGGDVVEVFQS
jgi:hypothetical protein